MRLVLEDHERADIDGDLANHMHQVHHWSLAAVRHFSEEALALAHDDDHDEMRRP